jgi:hypothetical protein
MTRDTAYTITSVLFGMLVGGIAVGIVLVLLDGMGI